jgi:hypothetical protein
VDPAPAPPFEVIETERGRTYRLPPRRIGPLRVLALLPWGMAAILGAGLAKLYLNRGAVRAMGLPDEWFWAVFVFLLLGWAWMTYTFLDMGASFWCGHSEIEVNHDGMVTAYDRAGRFGICLSWFKRGVGLRLILEECSPPPDRSRSLLKPPTALWQLSAQGPNGKKGWLVLGYPREILVALAEQLARHLGAFPPDPADPAQAESAPAAPAPPTAATPTPVAVVAEPEFPNRDTPEPPVKTAVTLERHPDGLTLSVPRRGLRGKNCEMFILSLALTAIGSFVVGLSIWAMFQPNRAGGTLTGQIMGVVVGGMFAAGGTVMLVVAVQSALEKVVLAVVGEKLLTFETTPFGATRREYARADILDIACVGTEHPELQIVLPHQPVVAMLARRDEAELKWVATVLRQALGIPSEAPEHRKPPPTPDKPWAAGRPRL